MTRCCQGETSNRASCRVSPHISSLHSPKSPPPSPNTGPTDGHDPDTDLGEIYVNTLKEGDVALSDFIWDWSSRYDNRYLESSKKICPFLSGPTSRLQRDGSLPAPAPSPAQTASRCFGRRARVGRSSSTRLCSPTSSRSSSGQGSESGSFAGRPRSQIRSSPPEVIVKVERTERTGVV